jgi:hypothetical protein
VRDPSGGEDQRAGSFMDVLLADLRAELAVDHVPQGIFVVMGVQRSCQSLRRDGCFDDRERPCGVGSRHEDASGDRPELERRAVTGPDHPWYVHALHPPVGRRPAGLPGS